MYTEIVNGVYDISETNLYLKKELYFGIRRRPYKMHDIEELSKFSESKGKSPSYLSNNDTFFLNGDFLFIHVNLFDAFMDYFIGMKHKYLKVPKSNGESTSASIFDFSPIVINTSVKWSEKRILKFAKYAYIIDHNFWSNLFNRDDVQISLPTFQQMEKYIDFKHFSKFPGFPWTEEFIEKYKSRLDWKNLSINKKLPWSESFIKKYETKIKFGIRCYEYSISSVLSWEPTLSKNEGIYWDEKLFKHYKERLDPLAFVEFAKFDFKILHVHFEFFMFLTGSYNGCHRSGGDKEWEVIQTPAILSLPRNKHFVIDEEMETFAKNKIVALMVRGQYFDTEALFETKSLLSFWCEKYTLSKKLSQ